MIHLTSQSQQHVTSLRYKGGWVRDSRVVWQGQDPCYSRQLSWVSTAQSALVTKGGRIDVWVRILPASKTSSLLADARSFPVSSRAGKNIFFWNFWLKKVLVTQLGAQQDFLKCFFLLVLHLAFNSRSLSIFLQSSSANRSNLIQLFKLAGW